MQNLACFAAIRVACFAAIRNRVSWLWQRLKAWLFDIQGDRLILWAPVCFGIGVGIYFYLPREPSIFELFLILTLPVAAILAPHANDALRILQAALLMTAAGLAVAGASSRWQASAMLAQPLPAVELGGWLDGIDRGASGQRRMILTGIQGGTDQQLPSGLRLTLPNGMDEPDVGSFIRVRARIYPIPPPAWVNGYDRQRALFFRGIGGLAEALEPPVVAIPAKSGSLASLRRTITARILAIDHGQAGALAVALTVGDRSLISPETDQAMRDSGLAHLLSISGLHIGLVALLVMGVIRRGGALWPWLALRIHLKKWAAGAAIIAAGLYSALAGWDVPVQRSFLSILVVLAAAIADRNPISLRPVAAAALAVLAVSPDALLGASFQMSFAAVIMLISGYERGWIKLARWRRADGVGRWLALWLTGTIASSLLATAATLPYAAYHFHRIALYGVISNILAIPLSGIVIMPMAVLALLAMPFGLEPAPLAGMMAGLDALQIIATLIAQWPGSSLAVAEMSDASLILFSLSGLWLCLWRGRTAAFLAVGMTLLALGLWWRHPVPDVMISARRGIVGINTGREIFIPGAKPAGLLTEIWRDLTGRLALTTVSPPPGGDFGDRRFGCRRDLCLLERYGRTLAIALTRAGAIAACGRYDLLLTRDFWPECSSSWRIVSSSPAGAAGLYLTPGGIAIVTDRQRRGKRLWVVLPNEPAVRD